MPLHKDLKTSVRIDFVLTNEIFAGKVVRGYANSISLEGIRKIKLEIYFRKKKMAAPTNKRDISSMSRISIYCYIFFYILVSCREPLKRSCVTSFIPVVYLSGHGVSYSTYWSVLFYCLITLFKLPHCRPGRQWPRFLHDRYEQLRF